MDCEALPFLHGAPLKTTGQIRSFCLDLQNKITESLERCGWGDPIAYRAKEIAKYVRLAINEEAERGAKLTKHLINTGTLAKNEENIKLTSASGYLESDGEVMVLLSLLDNWVNEKEVPIEAIVQENFGCSPYEALLAYSYDCVDIFSSSVIKKNGRSELQSLLSIDKASAIRCCNNAAEAWSFSRMLLFVEQGKGKTAKRKGALLKNFYEDRSKLYAEHVAIKKIAKWVESIKTKSFQGYFDLNLFENEILSCLRDSWHGKGGKLDDYAKNIAKAYVNNAIMEMACFLVDTRHPSEGDYKKVADIIQSSTPSLSRRRICGVLRMYFQDVKCEMLGNGTAH